jgi:hypothetical protein
MVASICNPSTREAKQKDLEFDTSLGLSQEKKKKERKKRKKKKGKEGI